MQLNINKSIVIDMGILRSEFSKWKGKLKKEPPCDDQYNPMADWVFLRESVSSTPNPGLAKATEIVGTESHPNLRAWWRTGSGSMKFAIIYADNNRSGNNMK